MGIPVRLCIAALILISSFAFASGAVPSFVQIKANPTVQNLAGCMPLPSLTSAVTLGNTIIVSVDLVSAAAPLNVSDSAGNVYTEALQPLIKPASSWAMYVWTTTVEAVPTTFTICSGGAVSFEAFVAEYSGVQAIDATASSGGPVNADLTFITAPVQTTCTTDRLFAFIIGFALFDIDTPNVSIRSTAHADFVLDQVLNATGNYSIAGTFQNMAEYGAMLVALKGLSCQQQVSSTVTTGQVVTIKGNAVVSSPAINGTLIVTGDLVLNSNSVLGSGSLIQVGGNAVISSSVTVVQGSQIVVNGTLSVSSGAVLTPVVSSLAPIVTINVANYQSISGSFSLNPAVLGTTLPAGQCATLGQPQPNYGSTALTVTVTIATQSCGTTSSGGSSLSTAAIIGIAVGGGVFVIGVIVLIIGLLLRRRKSQKEWDNVRKKLGDSVVLDG